MFRVAAARMVRPAMAAGTATVMVVGGVTFSACDAPVVPYAPGKNLHDTSTYYGALNPPLTVFVCTQCTQSVC